ncbi:MAG: hypothetical protein ACOCQD_02780 [archaeon]
MSKISSNFKIIVPKEIINEAIKEGVQKASELARTVPCGTTNDVVRCIKESFTTVDDDLFIMGIFIHHLQCCNNFEKSLVSVSSPPMISNLFSGCILAKLIGMNEKVMKPLWEEIKEGVVKTYPSSIVA